MENPAPSNGVTQPKHSGPSLSMTVPLRTWPDERRGQILLGPGLGLRPSPSTAPPWGRMPGSRPQVRCRVSSGPHPRPQKQLPRSEGSACWPHTPEGGAPAV